MQKPKNRDANQLAAFIVGMVTGTAQEAKPKPKKKNPAAVALGRAGGLKGGKARAASLTAKQRSEIAQKGAKARWEKKQS